jgi:Transglycosylase SLT domain
VTRTLLDRPKAVRRLVVLTTAIVAMGALSSVAPDVEGVPAFASSAPPASVTAAVAPAGVSAARAGLLRAAAAPGHRVERLSVAPKTRPARLAVAPFRVGTPSYAKWWARALMASTHGWASTGQFQCLVSLWDRESHWNYAAYNHGSGAAGIPQAMPGSKMRSAGKDWRTNPVTQIRWGLTYIDHAYGTPCGAWSHSRAHGWY